jgi:hypothetical protein
MGEFTVADEFSGLQQQRQGNDETMSVISSGSCKCFICLSPWMLPKVLDE